MNNKLQAKDLINLGLFTVLYFVIGCCGEMIWKKKTREKRTYRPYTLQATLIK